MTQPLAYQPPAQLDFPDRSGRLIAAGILLVLCGLLVGCMTAMIPIATMIPQPGQPKGQPSIPLAQLAPAVLMYGVLTLIFLSLGAGAIIKRRWSRPLTLIFSTHWLIAGILTVGMMLLFWPVIRAHANAANAPPGAAAGLLIGLIVGIGLIAVFMIVIPAIILFLLRHEGVRQTLEYYDPHPRWTDRCPLPVLGLALTLAVIGLLTLSAIAQPVFPAFGTYFAGNPARGILLVLAIGYFAAGHLVYRLRMTGWWLGLLLTVATCLAILPSALWMPLSPYYHATQMPGDQIEVMLENESIIRLSMAILPTLFAAVFTLYMLHTRKHMLTPDPGRRSTL